VRLFIAIVPPPEVQREALGEARSLQWSGEIRWLPPENVHLTLKFLGDTPDSDLAGLDAAIANVCSGHRALDLDLRGAGAFPSTQRGRVPWVGVGTGSERLGALASELEDKLASLGFERENRAFHPHATVGRAKSGKETGLRLGGSERNPRVGPLAFRAESVELLRSRLSEGGAVYSTVASYPLNT
jgi:2'-5' RNA ligase